MCLLLLVLVASACSSSINTGESAPETTVAVIDETAVDEVPVDEVTTGTSEDDQLVVAEIDNAKLLETLAEWERDVDGGGVVYVRNAYGQSASAAVGVDAATEEPLAADAQVRVGSISKVITAVLVMQLVDEGLVDLDAPVSTYVDGLELANDVTVRELLGHRSGIPNYTESRGFFEVVLGNPESTPEPATLVGFTNGESDFDPGSQYAYSNTNFVIAGMVVEAVRGQALNAALDTYINDPLGLTHTTFDDGTLTEVAAGYSAMVPSGTSAGQSYTSIAYGSWAAGGLVTTVDELAAIFDGIFLGDLLTPDSLTEMLGQVEDGAEYGLGLHGGSDFGVGHGGSIIGFNSMAQIDRETQELVIAVVNNDGRSPTVLTAKLTNFIRE